MTKEKEYVNKSVNSVGLSTVFMYTKERKRYLNGPVSVIDE